MVRGWGGEVVRGWEGECGKWRNEAEVKGWEEEGWCGGGRMWRWEDVEM